MYKSIILCKKKIRETFSIYLIKQFTKLLVGKTKTRLNVIEVLQVLSLSPDWIKPDTSTSPSIMVTSYHLNT